MHLVPRKWLDIMLTQTSKQEKQMLTVNETHSLFMLYQRKVMFPLFLR